MKVLFRSFFNRLLITLFCAIFLSVMAFYLAMNSSFRREARTLFENSVKIKALEVNFILSTFSSTTKALGTRSAIRTRMGDYLHGAVGLEGLKDYLIPRYIPGAASIENLTGSARFLPDGTRIASYGDTRLLAEYEKANPGLYRLQEGDRLYILVISSIEENGEYLGFDACLFDGAIITKNASVEVKGFELRHVGEAHQAGQGNTVYVTLEEKHLALAASANEAPFREASRQALKLVGLYSAFMLVSISLLSYFTIFRFVRGLISERSALNERLQDSLQKQDLLLKEVHHRIKNNLNTIGSLLRLQASEFDSPELASALEDAANRVRSMGLLYDQLYGSVNFTDLNMDSYLPLLVDQVIANFPKAAAIRVIKRVDAFTLDAKRLQPLAIIVNELLTNIMKYAFAGRQAGTITVSASCVDGRVSLAIQDDGIGMPEEVDFDHTGGFGLMLVSNLTKQIAGTIRIERGEGTRIVLEFKLG